MAVVKAALMGAVVEQVMAAMVQREGVVFLMKEEADNHIVVRYSHKKLAVVAVAVALELEEMEAVL